MRSTVADWVEALAGAITFYTRIPAGWLAPFLPAREGDEPAPVPHGTMRMAPLAGLLVGAAGALVLLAAAALTGSDLVAAVLAVAATLVLTGALHEDGLADFADALGGGDARQRLRIMADSATGAYGTAAVCLGLLVRVALIAALAAAAGALAAALALVAAHAVARAAALWLPYALPPARKSGAAVAFGRPDEQTLVQAALIALVVAFLFAATATGVIATLLAVLLAALAALAMTQAAARLFGGQTGDVSGATVQACEIAFLFGLVAATGW